MDLVTALFPLAVSLIQCLQSGDQDTVLKTLKRVPETQLQKEGLRALSLLLLDKRIKVSNAASALLRSLADSPRSRERVRKTASFLTASTMHNADARFLKLAVSAAP